MWAIRSFLFALNLTKKRDFNVAGSIKVDLDYEAENVLTAANDALREEFSFAQAQLRPTGGAERSDRAHPKQSQGVVAVDIDKLYRTGKTAKSE